MLPATFVAALGRAGVQARPVIDWAAASGRKHRLAVVAAEPDVPAGEPTAAG